MVRSPVYNIIPVPIEKIEANSYNPNSVAPPEMKLLYDSIKDVGSEGGGNGFTFAAYSAYELYNAAERAVKMFRDDRGAFEKLRIRAMGTDFSWKKSALEYIKLYETI